MHAIIFLVHWLHPKNILFNNFYSILLYKYHIYIFVHSIDNIHALRCASLRGYHNIVKLLLKNGSSVDANNDYSLRLASEKGHYDIVKLL